MTEDKKFSVALLVWFLTAGIGGHKIYIEEKLHYIFWYWLASICSFGIVPLVGLFRMKKRILEINRMNRLEQQ